MKPSKIIPFLKKQPLWTLLLISIIVILFFIHGLWDSIFKIDNTSVLLLLLLILLPYFPLITKIKFGDLEATITHEDVEKIEKKVEGIPEKDQEQINPEKKLELEDLAESEPTLALAKARIEIEKKIKSLAEVYLDKEIRYLSLKSLINKLKKEKIIDKQLGSLLSDIITVANRAIHGENVSKNNIGKLIQFAIRAIDELDFVVLNHVLKSESIKVINQKEVDAYAKSNYILKTIIPYVEEPQLKTYKLNQVELDAFLEGYDEYAEFIISLEKEGKQDKK